MPGRPKPWAPAAGGNRSKWGLLCHTLARLSNFDRWLRSELRTAQERAAPFLSPMYLFTDPQNSLSSRGGRRGRNATGGAKWASQLPAGHERAPSLQGKRPSDCSHTFSRTKRRSSPLSRIWTPTVSVSPLLSVIRGSNSLPRVAPPDQVTQSVEDSSS